jgi:hypothetical protein
MNGFYQDPDVARTMARFIIEDRIRDAQEREAARRARSNRTRPHMRFPKPGPVQFGWFTQFRRSTT